MHAKSPGHDEASTIVSVKLHSAPKGLLRYYILHRISQKPIHGYEVIQDIDSKTEGAWRPGAGSLYPILKKLVAEGLIKADTPQEEEANRRMYRITQRGSDELAKSKDMFANFQHRWGFLRKLFVELIEPEQLADFFVDGSNRQFQLAREILESKSAHVSPSDVEYMLREYIVNLERQMNWANERLSMAKPKLVQPPSRPRGMKAQ